MNFNNLNIFVIFFMFHLGNDVIRFVKPRRMCIRNLKKPLYFAFIQNSWLHKGKNVVSGG